jgi:hypothetical protein
MRPVSYSTTTLHATFRWEARDVYLAPPLSRSWTTLPATVLPPGALCVTFFIGNSGTLQRRRVSRFIRQIRDLFRSEAALHSAVDREVPCDVTSTINITAPARQQCGHRTAAVFIRAGHCRRGAEAARCIVTEVVTT